MAPATLEALPTRAKKFDIPPPLLIYWRFSEKFDWTILELLKL